VWVLYRCSLICSGIFIVTSVLCGNALSSSRNYHFINRSCLFFPIRSVL
jgi:hypothetical protein